MSFLFPVKTPAPGEEKPMQPAQLDECVMMSSSPVAINTEVVPPDSPSASSTGPTFHTSFTPTSTGGGSLSGSSSFNHQPTRGESLSGSSSFNNQQAGKAGEEYDVSRSSAGNTPPPGSSELLRNSSTGSSGSMSSISAPMQIPSQSQSYQSPSSSMLIPPGAHTGYGMTTKVGSSGSIHNIYHTNVVMTPASSHPSTPNAYHTHHFLSQGVPGMDLDAMPTRATSQSVTCTPSRSINASPILPTQAVPILFAPPQTRPAALSVPNLNVTLSTAPPTAATAEGHVPDEVSQLRQMFRAQTNLSRASFALGDTLGTGTFGRVRVVSFQQGATPQNTTPPAPIRPAPLQYFALKMLKKSEIIRLKQVEHIKAEKAILSRITHPFIVNLYAAFQDERYLYLTMEYVLGGELFSQLRKVGRFSNETAKFYAAEILLALQYMHSLQIVYRDLKPENLLIDREGHIKITDFGFAKDIGVDGRTWTLCGTPEYLAPEIIQSKGHGKAVDWWALGILIFEMLAGYPPFYDENPFGIYQKVLKGAIDFPKHMDVQAKDLIKKLLTADRTKRFGCLQHGAEDIRRHPWFKNLDWDKVLQRKYKPPFVPASRAPNDTSNFDRYPDSREGARVVELSDKEKLMFQDF